MDAYSLVEALGLLSRKISRYLRPIADAEGVSYTELVVLWKLSRLRKCRATEIADDIGIPPSTLTGVLDRLVSKGWILRVPDPDDRRAVLLEATEHLSELLGRIKASARDRLAGVLQSVPSDRIQGLVKNIEEIMDHLDRDEGES